MVRQKTNKKITKTSTESSKQERKRTSSISNVISDPIAMAFSWPADTSAAVAVLNYGRRPYAHNARGVRLYNNNNNNK